MKGNSKTGFGTAMYAIKDVQNMYQSFDKPEQIYKNNNNNNKVIKNIQKIQTVKPLIKNQPIKNQPKPNIILKIPVNNSYKSHSNQITHTKPNQIDLHKNQQKQQQIIKQSNNSIVKTKFKQLNIIQVNQRIFQLTSNKTSTKWKQYKLNQQNGLKASQIVENPKINFQINDRNIKQGNLGNCYLICSLAALTRNIQILKNRINDYEKFKVNMFQSGKYVQVNVQNSFRNTLSKPIQNDITCLVLQKAYAQLYGNYEAITMGHSIESMRDISGNVAEYIDLKNRQKLQKQVKMAVQHNQPMVIASKTNPINDSISPKHSYIVLNYQIKNNKFYLLLRDPRGWTKANFNVNVNIDKQLECSDQNGQFYVKYQDLIGNFQVITVSRYMSNSLYYYKTFGIKQLSAEGQGTIRFELKQKSTMGISIHQKHKKILQLGEKYEYKVLNIIISEISNQFEPIKCINTDFNCQQVCSFIITLQKGLYCLTGQIYPLKTNKDLFPEQKITLSINTQKQLFNFNVIQNFNLTKSLIMYIQSNRHEFKQLITKQNLKRYHGSLFGKLCILYQNYSGKQVIEQLQFETENIQIKQKKIKINKNQIKLVTYPIGPKNNCSHKCIFKSKTFYFK